MYRCVCVCPFGCVYVLGGLWIVGFTHTCILHKCTRIIQFTCHVYRANGRVLHLIAQFSHLANGKMQRNYCNALRLEKVMQSAMKSSRVFN